MEVTEGGEIIEQGSAQWNAPLPLSARPYAWQGRPVVLQQAERPIENVQPWPATFQAVTSLMPAPIIWRPMQVIRESEPSGPATIFPTYTRYQAVAPPPPLTIIVAADSAALSESPAILATFTGTDAAAFVETAIVGPQGSEAGTLTEVATIGLNQSDAATFVETTTVGLTGTDGAIGTEAYILSPLGSDTGTLAENYNLGLTGTDLLTLTDTVGSFTATISATDLTMLADAGSVNVGSSPAVRIVNMLSSPVNQASVGSYHS